MLLSDLGADVLRLERPAGRRTPFVATKFDVPARGRRSVAIDLKAADSAQLVLSLVARADVLLEPFRPGVAERLGIGPDVCLRASPGLIYARITGWGQTGPLAERAGHDINYAAVAGALGAIGEHGRKPVPPLNLVADFGGGGMLCVVGVLAALVERASSGLGQVVDVGMVDGVSTLLAAAHGYRSAGAISDERGTNALDGGAPYYDTYACADGKYIAVGAIEPRFFAELVRVLGIKDDVPPQKEKARWPELRERIAAQFASRSRADWINAFEGIDACVSPVLSLSEVMLNPHIAARQAIVEIDGVVQPSPAPRFSRTPGTIGVPPREPGQDTVAALQEWGLTEGEIDSLLDTRAVVEWQPPSGREA